MPQGLAVFPHRERVIFENNPLVEVVCQLRFPALLRLESEPPAAFQEKIRDRFPEMQREQTGLPAQVPEHIIKALGGAFPQGGYLFLTRDKTSKIALGSNSIAVSTIRYANWQEFSADIPIDPVHEISSSAETKSAGDLQEVAAEGLEDASQVIDDDSFPSEAGAT